MTRLVDDPRHDRSIHKDPIPRSGDVSLAVATLCPIIGLMMVTRGRRSARSEDSDQGQSRSISMHKRNREQ